MTIIEKDLAEDVDTVFANPFERNPDLLAANPLHKVPTLITKEGVAIHDSPVICEYLDTVGKGPLLYPGGSRRWAVKTQSATCDGMLDALFLLVMERRRPESEQSSMWKDRWEAAFQNSVAAVAQSLHDFNGSVNIAQISLGAALAYANFRTPDIDWQSKHGTLAEWFENFSRRPSMQATNPR